LLLSTARVAGFALGLLTVPPNTPSCTRRTKTMNHPTEEGMEMPVYESIERAVKRTVLASRALDAAADDVMAYSRRGGLLGNAAADLLQSEAAKVEQLAEEIAALEVA
jgi:hypothetical protein